MLIKISVVILLYLVLKSLFSKPKKLNKLKSSPMYGWDSEELDRTNPISFKDSMYPGDSSKSPWESIFSEGYIKTKDLVEKKKLTKCPTCQQELMNKILDDETAINNIIIVTHSSPAKFRRKLVGGFVEFLVCSKHKCAYEVTGFGNY